ncbi:MAG: hypothetical protein HYZ28_16850 [Myxococcales bacterium]|nr:hypothetical protein [Myxococcales bacterium]
MSAGATTDTPSRQELDRLQLELSSRSSVVHFAHAAVSMLLALIIAGMAAKLFWDIQPRYFYLGAAVWLLALGLAAYSVVRYLLGKRVLKVEARMYEELLALRRALRLDDPSALLPR